MRAKAALREEGPRGPVVGAGFERSDARLGRRIVEDEQDRQVLPCARSTHEPAEIESAPTAEIARHDQGVRLALRQRREQATRVLEHREIGERAERRPELRGERAQRVDEKHLGLERRALGLDAEERGFEVGGRDGIDEQERSARMDRGHTCFDVRLWSEEENRQRRRKRAEQARRMEGIDRAQPEMDHRRIDWYLTPRGAVPTPENSGLPPQASPPSR